MTTAIRKTDRVGEAIARLIDQFKGRPNIVALVTAIARQSQETEDASFGVIEDTLVSTAVGAQLDVLGRIVNVERSGYDDDDYRVRIAAKILQNKSSGATEELIQLCVALGGTSVTVSESPPAKVELEITVPVTNGVEIASVIAAAKAGGVGSLVTWFESSNPFRFDASGAGFDEGELANSLRA